MKWVSVEDQFPPKAGLYLVVAKWMGVIEKGEFDGNSNWHIHCHSFPSTHWMPLPEPPKDEE